jgi:hypothetical protein
MTTPAPFHVARKIADPRSRGACYWFEIERVYPDGRRTVVAIADDRTEARELVRQLDAAAAAQVPATEEHTPATEEPGNPS